MSVSVTGSVAGVSVGKSRKRWGRSYGGYYSNLIALWIGTRFVWLGYAIVWFAAAYYVVCAGGPRRASMAYLDRLRPGRGRLLRWWQTYRHMVEFGQLILDRSLMLASEGHGYAMSCQGFDRLMEAAAASRGVILLTAHFGNAEIAVPYLSKFGLTRPLHMVMYQDTSDPTEQFHTRHRHLLAHMNVISTTNPLDAGIKIMGALREGDLVAIRADRAMDGKVVVASLLGGQVNLPAGPFVAAALSDAPVVHVYTCRMGYRSYLCLLSEARSYGDSQAGTREERIARAAQDFVGGLEEMLRRHPYHWSNFYEYWEGKAGSNA